MEAKFKVGDKVKIPKTKSYFYDANFTYEKFIKELTTYVLDYLIISRIEYSFVLLKRGDNRALLRNSFLESDLELYEEKQQNMNKDKTTVLSLDNAKQMYNSGIESIKQFALNNFTKEELEAKPLPKNYQELVPNEKTYYIWTNSCEVRTAINTSRKIINANKCHFPTESLAKGALALAQLLQLRNAWWNGWKPIYNRKVAKYALYFDGEDREVIVSNVYSVNKLFVFETKELAEDFKETFKNLLWETREYL